jgi:hypothetical protein
MGQQETGTSGNFSVSSVASDTITFEFPTRPGEVVLIHGGETSHGEKPVVETNALGDVERQAAALSEQIESLGVEVGNLRSLWRRKRERWYKFGNISDEETERAKTAAKRLWDLQDECADIEFEVRLMQLKCTEEAKLDRTLYIALQKKENDIQAKTIQLMRDEISALEVRLNELNETSNQEEIHKNEKIIGELEHELLELQNEEGMLEDLASGGSGKRLGDSANVTALTKQLSIAEHTHRLRSLEIEDLRKVHRSQRADLRKVLVKLKRERQYREARLAQNMKLLRHRNRGKLGAQSARQPPQIPDRAPRCALSTKIEESQRSERVSKQWTRKSSDGESEWTNWNRDEDFVYRLSGF